MLIRVCKYEIGGTVKYTINECVGWTAFFSFLLMSLVFLSNSPYFMSIYQLVPEAKPLVGAMIVCTVIVQIIFVVRTLKMLDAMYKA